MLQEVNGLSATLVRSGVMAMVVVFGLALTPRLAHASKVCAPDGRGCFLTREKCGSFDIPKRWTCTASLAVNPQAGDNLHVDRNGRPVILENGKPVYILSDALDAQLGRKKVTADEFARLVLADRGSVSGQSLQKLSKEHGIPIVKQK